MNVSSIKTLSVAGAILFSVGFGLSACSSPSQATTAKDLSTSLRPVEVEPVKKTRVERLVKTSAELKASQEVLVASQISERILSFHFENGDRVRKGQILAHLRADSLKQGLAQMDAEIESLDAKVLNQKQELVRGKELFAGRVVTRQALDQLDSALAASLAKRKSLLATREQLAINAGYSTIRAPIAGVIAKKNLQTGDLANPQTPLCSIIVLDPLKVQVQIGELEAPLVELDQEAKISLDAFPGRVFDGRVSRIYPYLDSTTRTNTVEISLANPWRVENQRRLLSPGMYGRAQLVVQVKKEALVVPQQALMADDSHPDRQRLFVINDQGVARERHLRTGLKHGSFREVLDALQPGQQVVVVGQYGLVDGQAVEIKKSSETNKGA